YVSATTATTDVTAPTTSYLPVTACRELGTTTTVRTTAPTASATGSANSQRQVATSTRRAERNMPSSPPPPATAVQTPIAVERAWPGNDEVMTESVTGMIIAAPTP